VTDFVFRHQIAGLLDRPVLIHRDQRATHDFINGHRRRILVLGQNAADYVRLGHNRRRFPSIPDQDAPDPVSAHHRDRGSHRCTRLDPLQVGRHDVFDRSHVPSASLSPRGPSREPRAV
jgi:hypothetical protein